MIRSFLPAALTRLGVFVTARCRYARGPGFFFLVTARFAGCGLSQGFSSGFRDVELAASTEGAGVADAAEAWALALSADRGVIVRACCSVAEATAYERVGSGLKSASQR